MVLKVLAVEADDEGGEEEQRGDDGQRLHHLVLVVGDLCLQVVADTIDQIARELEPVEGAQELVVGAVERDFDIVREDLLAFLDLDDVVDDAPDGVAGRRERAADVQQIVAEVAEPAPRLRRRSDLDGVLELVDLAVERVDEVEVVLGDVVDEPVEHHPGVVVGMARFARRPRIVGVLVRRRLADAQQNVVRHDDVDLLVEDAIVLGDGDRDEEDAEDVVAVRLQGRPRLVGVT